MHFGYRNQFTSSDYALSLAALLEMRGAGILEENFAVANAAFETNTGVRRITEGQLVKLFFLFNRFSG